MCMALVGTSALLVPQPTLRTQRGTAHAVRMADDAATPVKVTGVTAMSEMELAEQSAKLDALSAKWRKRQEQAEYEDASRVGWVEASETINGRFAMFFLLVGLITEYYTGQSVPQQVYTLLQTLAIVDVSCAGHSCSPPPRVPLALPSCAPKLARRTGVSPHPLAESGHSSYHSRAQ